MRTEAHHENILLNAATLLLKDLNADFSILKHLHQKGTINERERCDQCKRSLQSRWDPQPVCIFSCGHSFHQRCSANNGWKCSLCLNEHEEIQSIINQRGVRRVVKGNARGEGQDEIQTYESPSYNAPRKTVEIEKEPKTTFEENFQYQM
jgi:hypothetical protein